MVNITTSIPQDIWNLAKEKHLNWNECIIRGIKSFLNEPFEPKAGEKLINESWKAKAENIQHSMQACIDELNRKIERLETNNVKN